MYKKGGICNEKGQICSTMQAALIVISSIPAYAASPSVHSDDERIVTTLTISDPESGEVWEWEIPLSESRTDAQIATGFMAPGNGGEPIKSASVEFNAGKYLAESLGLNPTVSTVLEDDATLTVGMTYSVNLSHNSVTLYNVFGSITDLGLYYVTQRTFVWRNPGANQGGKEYPGSNSWNYSVTPTEGLYSADVPPYTLLDCRLEVTGMTAYRDLSVKCELSL